VVASPFKSPLKRKEPPEETESPTKRPRVPASHRKSFEEMSKQELEKEIKTKEARLEELKRKKLLAEQKFSNQEEREKVQRLTAKWRTVCREVLVELHGHHAKEKADLALGELVDYLQIDPEVIRFSPSNQNFY